MQFGRFRFVFFLLLLVIGAALLWGVQVFGGGASNAAAMNLSFSQPDWRSSVQSLDEQVAQMIRSPQWRSGSMDFSLPEMVQSAASTTLSATFSTTPKEFWQSVRERGAQEAVGEVLTQAQLQAGAVSVDVVNEARYQYCKGVVSAYESSPNFSRP